MDDFVKAALRLTTNFISARSVAIVVRDRAGTPSVGSATCIGIAGKCLLATAGHVIEDHFDDRIELIPAGRNSPSRLPFIDRSCAPGRPSPPTDVAWIRLDPEVVSNARVKFLELKDLKLSQPPDDLDHPFVLHGYPQESAIMTTTAADVESTAAFTTMAPAPALYRSLRSFEVATYYPPLGEKDEPLTETPAPFGISGGGLWWHPRHDEVELTSPTQMKLVGLNTQWHRRTSILFSTRIDEWLAVVRTDFPDTLEVISKLETG